MSEWKKVKLGEITQIIDGDRGKNYPKNNEFSNVGYCLFLNTGNVTKEGFTFENNQFISKEKDNLLRKGKIQRGDLILTTRGTVGNIGFYDNHIKYDNIRINSGMVILRVIKDIVDAQFLYQLIRGNECRTYIKSFCTGSAQPQLPIKNLSQIDIKIPHLLTQHRIATILSRYDSLIENYQKQIKLLEEAAQRLYKEWFVDLHFPGHESTKFVDGVPEGWEKKPALDFFEMSIGKTPPRAQKQWFTKGNNGIPWVSISDMKETMFVQETAEELTQDACENYNIKVVPRGTILLSFKLTVGRVAFAGADVCTNEAIAHFQKEGDEWKAYTLMYLRNYNYDSLGNTSGISKAVNSTIIKNMPFVMPCTSILQEFSQRVLPFIKQTENLQSQIRLLTEARDRLLPKLMSGEIEV